MTSADKERKLEGLAGKETGKSKDIETGKQRTYFKMLGSLSIVRTENTQRGVARSKKKVEIHVVKGF